MQIDKIMQAITGLLLLAFAAFLGAWYLDKVQGNFALLLFVICCVTGVFWVAERLFFAPRRLLAAQNFEAEIVRKRAHLAAQGITQTDNVDIEGVKADLVQQPWWLDWTAGLFPVIICVFMFRSFVFEPFKIPSGSMIPTLLIGDLILVNKFTYGVRLPVVHAKVTQGSPPVAGDVMVFRYPPDPSLDYIKRVVGVPGDEVSYLNKQLLVNGKPVAKAALADFFDEDQSSYHPHFEEDLAGRKHRILVYPGVGDIRPIVKFPHADACAYSLEGVVCKVPAGHYFMMGDNRDNSLDSRFWGFVPEANIVGRASLVWMNLSHLSRIGTSIR